jgi:hypothetical protein
MVKPDLPFDLPEMPEDSAATTPPVPGAAGALPAPNAGPGQPGVAVPGAFSQAQAAVVQDDIRDIRGPIHVRATTPWGRVFLAAALVLGGLVAAWIYLRRRSSVRARLAFEIAFDQLERARALMQPEQAREFSILVSRVIRTYLDHRFDVGMTHCTTEEFLAGLVSRPRNPLQTYAGPLRDFLGHCDLAKFAGFALSVPQMEAMHSSAWRLVDETRPRPEQSKTKPAVPQDPPSALVNPGPAFAAGGAS